MRNIMSAFLAGLLFGGGLLLSGMADPANVLAFFDIAGAWNPSLALVMAGGLGVTMLGYSVVGRRAKLPPLPSTGLDLRLFGGAAVFGLGWGLSGYCPGPALAASASGFAEAAWFTAAMVAGMLAWNLVSWRLATCPILAARRS